MLSKCTRLLGLGLFTVLPFVGYSQNGPDSRRQSNADTISLEQFTGQVGRTVTITDYKLPDVSLGMNRLYGRIRKATVEGETRYYYLFSKTTSGFEDGLFDLNYDEVVEMQQAVNLLKSEVERSLQEKALYKESRYATYHVVRVGYFVEDGKVRWFVDGNPNGIKRYRRTFGTINIADITPFEKSLADAKQKIDQLKAK